MQNLTIPVGVFVCAAFGLVYGWILHRAANARAYKISGIRIVDAYLLAWLFGLFAAFTPVYVALGFKEFADTPTGSRLLRQLHWVGRGQIVYMGLYALFTVMTVPQRLQP